jgi:hypothetical protein
MDRPIAVLDACVLYSAPLRDVLLEMTVDGLFLPRWSDAIHEEWISHVLENRPDLDRSLLRRTRQLMERAFPDALVAGYQKHVAEVVLPDSDDRHVVAAAVASGATVIVTNNVRDFPAAALEPLKIIVQRPEDFLCSLFDTSPEIACRAVQRLRGRLKPPPMSVAAYLEVLERQSLCGFVARLRKSSGEL